ncbi:Rpn family recombination-promoting nuclease/putative transposase [Treponema primitia]|uniref:Rpn family recombination-promoting nuclease/putative transposase n=1 Tax=Treponema primitia TaxID=88058 RepID=UPI0002555349|nr:Rpn family recombination-promoting nuclease/putative transposase [Treponema primitia]
MKKPMLKIMVDYVFKLIFGDQRNIDILAGFLKAALNLPEAEYDSLSIVDPNLKREFADDKAGVLDVKIHTKTGIVIDVEIQVSAYGGLRKRLTEYAVKMVTEQIKRGENWKQANRVVCIIIINDILIPEEKDYYNRYALLNRETGTEFTDLLEINTLELPKLPKQSDGSDLYMWSQFFTSETEEDFMMVAEKDPVIKKAVATLMELSEDERERLLAESREKFLYDQYHREKESYEKGLSTGREEAYQEKLESARKLKARGFSGDEISGILQLVPKDIAKL